MPYTRPSAERANFSAPLSHADIDELRDDPVLKVLQTDSPVGLETWKHLNDAFFAVRPDVTLRLYGFYSSVCDLSFLLRMPNVEKFAADCLRKATHVESIASLPNLRSLSVGIYDLESFEFLKAVSPDRVSELALSATKSKKPSIELLAGFSNLRSLYLEGQQKGIESISRLSNLEKLTLRSITVPGLEFLRDLKNLWSLDIKLGGTNNLNAIDGLTNIKYLELWQVKGLCDISVVSTLLGLQFLFLQSLPHIETIPDLSRLTELRRVYLENMKGLKDVESLAKAPALEEFMDADARGVEPGDYQSLLNGTKLKRILVGFGSSRKNEILREMATQAGISESRRTDFFV